jgi:hypothetical protein
MCPISFDKRVLYAIDSPEIIDLAWPDLSLIYSLLTRMTHQLSSHAHFGPAFFRRLLLPNGTADSKVRSALVHFFAAPFRNARHHRLAVIRVHETALIDSRAGERSPFFVLTGLTVFLYIAKPTVQLLPSSE